MWQVLDATGLELASADMVVLAAGHASRALADTAGLTHPLALQAIRGQVCWALHASDTAKAMPDFPVNGHGSLLPAVPLDQGMAWVTGSTFERDNTSTDLRPADEQHKRHDARHNANEKAVFEINKRKPDGVDGA